MNMVDQNFQQENQNPQNLEPDLQPKKIKLQIDFFEKLPKTLLMSIAVFTLVLPIIIVMILSFGKNNLHSSSSATINSNYTNGEKQCNGQIYLNQCGANMNHNNINQFNTQPKAWLLAIPCFVLIVFTTAILFYAKSKLGFRTSWLILSISYNAMIIITKFFISPLSLYSQNISVTNGLLGLGSKFDPSSSVSNIFTGLIIFSLYILVLVIVNFIFKKKFNLQMQNLSFLEKIKQKKIKSTKKTILSILLIALSLPFIFFAVYLWLSFFGGSGFGYLGYIAAAVSIPMVIAIIFFVGAYRSAYQQAIQSRNVIFLTSFFTLAFLLVLSIHIIWVVFLLVIASLWPFNITYYSSK